MKDEFKKLNLQDKVICSSTATLEPWLNCQKCSASYYRNSEIPIEEMRGYPRRRGWIFKDDLQGVTLCMDCVKVS